MSIVVLIQDLCVSTKLDMLVYVCICVSLCFCMYVSMSVPVYVSVSLYICARERVTVCVNLCQSVDSGCEVKVAGSVGT